ncbi:MAG: 4Fe-4S dicluster domain-containing protein [Euryarchaeota archaeon]|nr:4Fe-4S dicluster domain-containing protein [Euryarchaeota archaeon]
MKIMPKKDFFTFVDALIETNSLNIEGPKAKGEKFVFGPLESSDELRLDYDTTILPPKKYFLPQYETMMTYDSSKSFSVEKEEDFSKRVIIGVHPYDIVAIKQMDKYFTDTHVDDSYLQRRKNTLIIGLNVVNVAEKAFFGDMGTGSVDSGYDLMLTDLGDKIAVEIGTEKGKELLKKHASVQNASSEEAAQVKAAVANAEEKAKRDLQVPPKEWHSLMEKAYESDFWAERAEKCLACGTCTLVCPTCFCYDVNDEVYLDLTGERVRTWDGCLLRGFTEVGTGEIFREGLDERYRHRFNRKGRYLPDMLGFVACVGCGRCSSQCLPDIADPVDLMNSLAERISFSPKEPKVTPLLGKYVMPSSAEEPLHLPKPATLKRVAKLTELETLFEIELDDGKPLGHEPGQFVEVSIMGYGEAPISVSSAPNGNIFELVVRKVGDVTSKLHTMKPGDKIGIRGPFGKGFDVEALKGKNLLFVGGGIGIVPMRSLINYVLNNRKEFGEVTILYGCKKPSELLFTGEVAQWKKREDVQFLKSIDNCPEGVEWDGKVGVITCLIPKAEFDPENTIAIVVGPPIMYKFVIRDLIDLGTPEENIIVSLERRMKCGVGKCGHCQINGIYVCKDGPVFNYKDIKDLPEAF